MGDAAGDGANVAADAAASALDVLEAGGSAITSGAQTAAQATVEVGTGAANITKNIALHDAPTLLESVVSNFNWLGKSVTSGAGKVFGQVVEFGHAAGDFAFSGLSGAGEMAMTGLNSAGSFVHGAGEFAAGAAGSIADGASMALGNTGDAVAGVVKVLNRY